MARSSSQGKKKTPPPSPNHRREFCVIHQEWLQERWIVVWLWTGRLLIRFCYIITSFSVDPRFWYAWPTDGTEDLRCDLTLLCPDSKARWCFYLTDSLVWQELLGVSLVFVITKGISQHQQGWVSSFAEWSPTNDNIPLPGREFGGRPYHCIHPPAEIRKKLRAAAVFWSAESDELKREIPFDSAATG